MLSEADTLIITHLDDLADSPGLHATNDGCKLGNQLAACTSMPMQPCLHAKACCLCPH